MGAEGNILAIFLLGIASAASSINTEFQTSLETFSSHLFSNLMASAGNNNIIYSPFSIQTCLAMTRLGADGQTAVEMDQGLGFTGQTPESVADNYQAILAKYENSNVLKIANKVYVTNSYELAEHYEQLLSQKFLSSAEIINFSQTAETAKTINTWVESKTDHKIKNLISPNVLDANMRLVLLSVIHFNGKWARAFQKKHTKEEDFYAVGNKIVKVPMMSANGKFELFASMELQADVLRLPYKDSDLSILIILPFPGNSNWSILGEKLKHFQLKTLGNNLKRTRCQIYLPKFKADFEIDLNDVLQKMGMNKMFGEADFTKMLKSSSGLLNVAKFIHKAVIEVNEEGTEAAGATGILLL